MKSDRKECAICGRIRAVNSARSRQDVCASCRYFTASEPPGEWSSQAACVGVDPELFWPESRHEDTTKQAQAICMTCPVIGECLDYALATNQAQGIWGGLTPTGRLTYRKLIKEAV